MNEHAPQQPDGLASLPAIVDMAQTYKLSPKAFAFTFRSVAMPKEHTEAEFVSCCLVAAEHGLNPLTKEIYFMRTKAGAIQPIVSVDGWIRKCNEHPQYDGMELTPTLDDKGSPIAMTISIYRKDRSRPTTITEYFEECSRAGGPVWKTNPHRMLRNRTICQGARLAFGFAGIMAPDEFDQWQAMKDVTPKAALVSDDIPEIPEDDTPDIIDPIPDDDVGDGLAPDQEKLFLDALAESMAAAKTPEEREEIAESNDHMLDRLSDAGRRKAEAIIEGRA